MTTDPSSPSGPQYLPLLFAFNKPEAGSGALYNPPMAKDEYNDHCQGCHAVYKQVQKDIDKYYKKYHPNRKVPDVLSDNPFYHSSRSPNYEWSTKAYWDPPSIQIGDDGGDNDVGDDDGDEESQGGGLGLVWIVISLSALALVVALFVIVFVIRFVRRRPVSHEASLVEMAEFDLSTATCVVPGDDEIDGDHHHHHLSQQPNGETEDRIDASDESSLL